VQAPSRFDGTADGEEATADPWAGLGQVSSESRHRGEGVGLGDGVLEGADDGFEVVRWEIQVKRGRGVDRTGLRRREGIVSERHLYAKRLVIIA
jgi:hypothetical protein